MPIPLPTPTLPPPPDSYDREWMNAVLRNLDLYFRSLHALGPAQCSQLTLGSGGATVSSGAGSPEGVVQARKGSLYTRTDGGAHETLYYKSLGDDAFGWVLASTGDGTPGGGTPGGVTSITITELTATAGQTAFEVAYSSIVLVWADGRYLSNGRDFIATSGTSVILTAPATEDTEFLFAAISFAGVTASVVDTVLTSSGTDTFAVTYAPGQILAFIDGLAINDTADYTATSGTSLVTAATVPAGLDVQVAAFAFVGGTPLMPITDFTATAGQTDFTCTHAVGRVLVWVNGYIASPTRDYSDSGSAIILNTGVPLGTAVKVLAI